jgi:hypothetical protein
VLYARLSHRRVVTAQDAKQAAITSINKAVTDEDDKSSSSMR